MDIQFTELSVCYGSTQVLHDVYGKVEHGELLAVVGPSGAGKSTLLHAITGKLPLKSGNVTVNGKKVTSTIRRQIAYVLQNELFFPNLTLRETLHFSTMMRLPDSMPYHEKIEKMNFTVKELELESCLDTLVGNAVIRGLSGGQRKRANIACEIVGDPTIIAIDEPTSGLDAAIALKIMKLLKKYTAVNNKTVIINIHQPTSQIFEMFDNILLMTSGRVGYYGLGKDLLSFLTDIGLPCELHYNPAEYAMECVKKREKEDIILEAAQKFQTEHLKQIEAMRNFGKAGNGKCVENLDENAVEMKSEDTLIQQQSWITGHWTQFKTILYRHMKQRFRVTYSPFNIINTCVITFFFALIWFQLPKTDESILYKQGLIFLFTIHFGFRVSVGEIIKYHGDRDILNRERSSGLYRASAYYMAMLTTETSMIVPLPTLCLIVIYWATGLTTDFVLFLAFTVTFVLFLLSHQSMSWVIAALIDNTAVAVSVCYSIETFMACAGGFLIKNQTVWLSWTKYLSLTYFTFQAMQHIEFTYGTGLEVSPPDNETTTIFDSFTNCTFTTNSSRAENLERSLSETEPLWVHLTVLSVAILLLRIAGYGVIRFVKKPA